MALAVAGFLISLYMILSFLAHIFAKLYRQDLFSG
jgi:hypothetical protein